MIALDLKAGSRPARTPLARVGAAGSAHGMPRAARPHGPSPGSARPVNPPAGHPARPGLRPGTGAGSTQRRSGPLSASAAARITAALAATLPIQGSTRTRTRRMSIALACAPRRETRPYDLSHGWNRLARRRAGCPGGRSPARTSSRRRCGWPPPTGKGEISIRRLAAARCRPDGPLPAHPRQGRPPRRSRRPAPRRRIVAPPLPKTTGRPGQSRPPPGCGTSWSASLQHCTSTWPAPSFPLPPSTAWTR